MRGDSFFGSSNFQAEYRVKRNFMLAIFCVVAALMFSYGYYRETNEKPKFMGKCTQQNTYGECELIWSQMNTPAPD